MAEDTGGSIKGNRIDLYFDTVEECVEASRKDLIDVACDHYECIVPEDEFYTEMTAKMPKVGQRVSTPDGEGETVSLDVLHEQVEVKFVRGDETERKMYQLEDVKFS